MELSNGGEGWQCSDYGTLLGGRPGWTIVFHTGQRAGIIAECIKFEADARLMAASPRLMRSLEALLAQIDRFKLLPESSEWVENAREALKIAQGR